MNKPIQRWDVDADDIDASMFTNKTGDYVLYADHVVAMEALVQPVQPAEPIVWCQYIAGMIETYLQMSPKLENREYAIASIIERRLTHLSQPVQPKETK